VPQLLTTLGATIDTTGKVNILPSSLAVTNTDDLVLFAKLQLLQVTGDDAVHFALIVRDWSEIDDPTFKAFEKIEIWDSDVH